MLECQKEHRVHIWWDPEQDFLASDIETYLEDRDNQHLVFPAGSKPLTFTCRPLSTTVCLSNIGPMPPGSLKWQAAFRAAVIRVDNVDGWMKGDHTGSWAPQATLNGGVDPSQAFVLTQREVDLFTPDVVQEVGEVVFKRSFLALGRPGGAGLPDTSLRILGVMRAHLAALQSMQRDTIPTGSTPQAETSTSEGSTSPSPDSASSESTKSAEDGDATAAAPASEDDDPTSS